jgi:2-polyprenyl-3-methyl-5-hydroxy-6-metoxy-1,4-benzoquinol methylase
VTQPADASGALTNESFWDAQWEDRAARSLVQTLLHGREFGRDGTFLRTIRRHVGADAIRGARVVELGGAASRFLLDFALWEGARVTAVDYSPVGIEQTRALFARHRVDGEAVEADMFAWRDGDGAFDVVTHWGVLEHFDDPAPTLATSARMARPGGLVVFTMPNLAARGAALWKRFAPGNFSKHVYHTDEAVRAACDAAGLVLERQFHCGPPLVRMAPPERGGLAAQAVNVVHAALCGLGTLAPGLYVEGAPALASQRGFVTRRRAG